jgi:hypothetical protein
MENHKVDMAFINYKPWTSRWILKKSLICIEEHRLPERVQIFVKSIIINLQTNLCIAELKLKDFFIVLNQVNKKIETKQKFLYVSFVGKYGKELLAKVIRQFGYEDFDYLIFVYDNAEFREEIYNRCNFIYQNGIKWQFLRKYLTYDRYKKYDYIFLWDDDLDIGKFSYKNFIEIMKRNDLEIAQPALTDNSYYSHKLTLKNEKHKIGRYTDFVEVMAPVFSRDAWSRYRNMIESNPNSWGWGYDLLAKSVCKYKNMGIVDCESITHTRPIRSKNTNAPEEMKMLFKIFKGYRLAKKVAYKRLK